MKLQREFHSMACKTREDPELFILRLEEARISLNEVQNEDSEKITEDQFLLHLLHSLPEEYESTVTQLLYEMKNDDEEDNTSKIDLEALMDALSEKFENTKEKRWRNKNDEDETALIAANQPRAVPNYNRGGPQKRTNIRCNSCGLWGHKSSNWRNRKPTAPPNNNTMECWWWHRRGHMKRDCNEWNQTGKPQCPRRDVANVVVDHNQQSNKGETPRQHRKEAWLVRNGHNDDVCLLNMDMCLTMIEDDGKIQEIFDKDTTYDNKDNTYIDEEGIKWDLESMTSSKMNMEGIEETKIEGLQELNLKYESSSTGTMFASRSIRSIQSREYTDELAMSAVTGHENEGLKISNSMDEEIYDLYGSEEENNISEVPRLMNMNYEVKATQCIQAPELALTSVRLMQC
jgi:hypothetical protein